MFDVAEARFPARAERLIATAFPSPDPEIGVVVGRSIESLARERSDRDGVKASGVLEAVLDESLGRSRKRLSPVPIHVVIWNPGSDLRPGNASPVPSLSSTDTEKTAPLWSLRLPSRSTALPETGFLPRVFTGKLSLLDRDLVSLFESAAPGETACLIARDPFSEGRLDGSRFAATAMLSGPGSGPVDVRRLRADFEPVLGLGFLTKDRQRTLAQAALRFVLHWPWVATAVVPLPAPERLEEVLRFGETPPLSQDELDRLSLVK
jgi:hypothetical protein